MFTPDSRLMIVNVDRDKIERLIRLYPECRILPVEDIVDCCIDLFISGSDGFLDDTSSGNLIYPTN